MDLKSVSVTRIDGRLALSGLEPSDTFSEFLEPWRAGVQSGDVIDRRSGKIYSRDEFAGALQRAEEKRAARQNALPPLSGSRRPLKSYPEYQQRRIIRAAAKVGLPVTLWWSLSDKDRLCLGSHPKSKRSKQLLEKLKGGKAIPAGADSAAAAQGRAVSESNAISAGDSDRSLSDKDSVNSAAQCGNLQTYRTPSRNRIAKSASRFNVSVDRWSRLSKRQRACICSHPRSSTSLRLLAELRDEGADPEPENPAAE